LLENIVEVAIDTADRHERYTYYHGGSIDWEYLLGLFEPYEGGSQESSEDTIPVETQPKEPPALPWHK